MRNDVKSKVSIRDPYNILCVCVCMCVYVCVCAHDRLGSVLVIHPTYYYYYYIVHYYLLLFCCRNFSRESAIPTRCILYRHVTENCF